MPRAGGAKKIDLGVCCLGVNVSSARAGPFDNVIANANAFRASNLAAKLDADDVQLPFRRHCVRL